MEFKYKTPLNIKTTDAQNIEVFRNGKNSISRAEREFSRRAFANFRFRRRISAPLSAPRRRGAAGRFALYFQEKTCLPT